MLYSNCTIYSNTFRLTRNHILQRMTVCNIPLLIRVHDSGKKFENFDRNIKYIIDGEHNRDNENPKNYDLIHAVLRTWSKG